MKNNFYKRISLILLITVFIMATLLIKATKDQVVAVVNNKKIYDSDVEKELSGSSYKMALNSLINTALIDIAFEDNVYNITNDEMDKYLEYVIDFDHNKYDLSDEDTYNFVQTYVKVRKLIEKYSLTDEELQEFIESETNQLGNKEITLKVIYGSDEDLNSMYTFNNIDKINKYIEEHSLEIIEKKVFSTVNYFATDFNKCSVNDIFLYQGDGEIDEDIYSNKNALLIVKDINNAVDTTLNLNENREEIVDVYLSKNYFKEKLKLTNSLQSYYEIKK